MHGQYSQILWSYVLFLAQRCGFWGLAPGNCLRELVQRTDLGQRQLLITTCAQWTLEVDLANFWPTFFRAPQGGEIKGGANKRKQTNAYKKGQTQISGSLKGDPKR